MTTGTARLRHRLRAWHWLAALAVLAWLLVVGVLSSLVLALVTTAAAGAAYWFAHRT